MFLRWKVFRLILVDFKYTILKIKEISKFYNARIFI
jgi:hypothetical protein